MGHTAESTPPKLYQVALTTDAAGDATATFRPLAGEILEVIYEPAAVDGFAAGTDLTVARKDGLTVLAVTMPSAAYQARMRALGHEQRYQAKARKDRLFARLLAERDQWRDRALAAEGEDKSKHISR